MLCRRWIRTLLLPRLKAALAVSRVLSEPALAAALNRGLHLVASGALLSRSAARVEIGVCLVAAVPRICLLISQITRSLPRFVVCEL